MEEIIDKHLKLWVDNDLNYLPIQIEREMLGSSKPTDDGWYMWKPIPSQIEDSEISQFEEYIGYSYPKDYKRFLKHMHFYDLQISECAFCPHPINSWKKALSKFIFQGYPKELTLFRGKIPFANWSDWGLLCFDTNLVEPNNTDYPIVLWDHEYQDEFEYKYPNFETMIHELDKEATNSTNV